MTPSCCVQIITMNQVLLNKKTIALTYVFVKYNEQDYSETCPPYSNKTMCYVGQNTHSGIWGNSLVTVRQGMQMIFLLGVFITVQLIIEYSVKMKTKVPLLGCVVP